MQKQDVAGRQAAPEAPQENRRIAPDGVEAAPRPGHVEEPGRRERRVEQGAADAGGRAEEARRLAAGRVGDRALRGGDLPPHRPERQGGEAGEVAVGVVLGAVAAPDHLPD
ncbi:MAG: hypothetical protein AVDCRST_MAG08-664 [uncultured Acetobacteraceae bacterium]|uniref:Uncharacterized protein n=1 Tax=uncultured Acetobacteraceae bacterium TaxID=169975 RepID=A0A6J4HH90_9PROT|nr:MAG: hypothetical protein AVDCRST_MAG08-664 [uncultured Acetobacteraceae bacterium]